MKRLLILYRLYRNFFILTCRYWLVSLFVYSILTCVAVLVSIAGESRPEFYLDSSVQHGEIMSLYLVGAFFLLFLLCLSAVLLLCFSLYKTIKKNEAMGILMSEKSTAKFRLVLTFVFSLIDVICFVSFCVYCGLFIALDYAKIYAYVVSFMSLPAIAGLCVKLLYWRFFIMDKKLSEPVKVGHTDDRGQYLTRRLMATFLDFILTSVLFSVFVLVFLGIIFLIFEESANTSLNTLNFPLLLIVAYMFIFALRNIPYGNSIGKKLMNLRLVTHSDHAVVIRIIKSILLGVLNIILSPIDLLRYLWFKERVSLAETKLNMRIETITSDRPREKKMTLLRRRIFASLQDMSIGIVFFLSVFIIYPPTSISGDIALVIKPVLFSTTVLLCLFLYPVIKDMVGGASIGKRMYGLVIRDSRLSAKIPSSFRLLLRGFGSLFLLPLDVLFILWRADKKKLSDLVLHTAVIPLEEDLI